MGALLHIVKWRELHCKLFFFLHAHQSGARQLLNEGVLTARTLCNKMFSRTLCNTDVLTPARSGGSWPMCVSQKKKIVTGEVIWCERGLSVCIGVMAFITHGAVK